jgi:hypothetical protein
MIEPSIENRISQIEKYENAIWLVSAETARGELVHPMMDAMETPLVGEVLFLLSRSNLTTKAMSQTYGFFDGR